jgi:cyclopropane-fatty-acyl-phospholipid synthase
MRSRSLSLQSSEGFSRLPSALVLPKASSLVHTLAAEMGVRINGDAPWDIRVTDPRFYGRVFLDGSLGFGEAYMDGWWDCERLDQLFHKLLAADIDRKIERWTNLRRIGSFLRQAVVNLQSHRRAFQVAERHYDVGNDLFAAMLDPTMSYSCGYWRRASSLEEAQRDKLDLICRKLYLQPGDRLLDIGCGWGGLARHAAANYGAEVLGITVSIEQQKLARERCAGLPVNIKLMDYRDLAGRFDKVASVGMFEHVGPKNHAVYFATIQRILDDDGLFLLHTIGSYRATRALEPWMDKYIFPNGCLPSAAELAGAVEEQFIVEDWHNFGPDYDRTLMAWWENFERAWPALEPRYGGRFHRLWKYYLLSCAGFFRSRQGQLWQVVLSKQARSQGYQSVR